MCFKSLRTARLAAGFGFVLAATMIAGCLSPDRRANTTTQQRIPKTNSNTTQATSNNSGATNTTGINANNSSAGQNSSPYVGGSSNVQTAANNTAGPATSNMPAIRPIGISAAPNNSLPGTNMNNPPQFNGGMQQAAVNGPAAGPGGLQTIATSTTAPNRPAGSIQGPNGAAVNSLPPLDAVPSASGAPAVTPAGAPPRNLPQAVSTQWGDGALKFPTNQPLMPTPAATPGATNNAAGQIQPLPLPGN
ncbi:MAG TPA: hypothetical protein VGZ47_01350 [Gemmataceae bacterium]|nr:hypothetical protein [Gemmataceae bacterium]